MNAEVKGSQIVITRFLFAKKRIEADEIESMLLRTKEDLIRLKSGKEIRLKPGRLYNYFVEDDLSELAAKNHISFEKEIDYSETSLYFEDFQDVMRRAEADQRVFEAEVEPYVKAKLSDSASIRTEILSGADRVLLVINIVKDGMKVFPKSDGAPEIYKEKFGLREVYALDVLDEAMMVRYDSLTNNSRWLTLDDVNNMIPSIKNTVDEMCTNGMVYAAEAGLQIGYDASEIT